MGRYWLPVLPAAAVGFAVGALSLVPERLRDRALLGAGLFLAVWAGGFLWGALVPNHWYGWGA